MGTFRKYRFSVLILSFTTALLLVGSGCSHKASQSSSASQDAASASPDAGTDAVPQAAVEDRSADATSPPAPIAENSDGTAPIAEATPDAATPPTVATAPVPPAPTETEIPAGMNSSGPPQAIAETPAAAPEAPAVSTADADGNYVVRQGDTLMRIAFDNYGDLYKWKDIYEANKDKISDPNTLPPGTQLKLDPSARVTVAHNGSQYMIKGGDTLGTISTDVYGTRAKWKRLWESNKELIQDPNKIYAGFYLYYTLTPKEREEFRQRKGVEPEDSTVSPTPLAQQQQAEPAAPQPQAIVEPPAPVQAPAAPVAQPAQAAAVNPTPVAPAADNFENIPPPPPSEAPQAAAPAPVQAQPVQAVAPPPPAAPRTPASVPAAESAATQLPALGSAPPPAEHSADLNEVIRQAQQEESIPGGP